MNNEENEKIVKNCSEIGSKSEVLEENKSYEESSSKKEESTPVLEYNKATMSRRLCSSFIDIFIAVFFAFLLFACSNLVLPYISSYQNVVETRNELMIDSGLYDYFIDHDDLILITEYTETEDTFDTYEERKNFLSSAIDEFYQNELFFTFDEDDMHLEDYKNRKLAYCHDDGGYIFEEDEEGNAIENSTIDEYLYDFYYEEINSYSLGYLINNDDYVNSTRIISIVSYALIFVWYLISVIIFYYVIPTTLFKRGRQTLGMKICSIGLIDGNALNISLKKYSLRFLFALVFMFILNIFCFLIPLIISISMMYFTKTSQDLNDYVFNNYMVDVKNQDIYLDYMEFLDKTNFERNISIENKDLVIKN